MIFATEPLFATFFAWLLGKEIITPLQLAGGSCILASVIVADLPKYRTIFVSKAA